MTKRIRFFSAILSAAVSLGMVSPVLADPKALIDQGDALYSQRSTLAKNQEALSLYKKAIAEDPTNAEAQWRASRAAWWVGTLLEKRSERIASFQEGIKFGELAVRTLPDSADAHFWLGGNYASFGNVKGAFTSLGLIKSIRKEMSEVIRINDKLIGGGAYRILGILDYKVPGFIGGDKKRAMAQLQKALAIDPSNPLTIYYLADYYASLDQKEKGREYLAQFRSLKPSDEFEPEYQLMIKQEKEDKLEARLN